MTEKGKTEEITSGEVSPGDSEERSNPGSISVACRGPDDVLIQIDGDEITMLSLSLDADQAAKLADDLDAASMSARLFAGQVKAVE